MNSRLKIRALLLALVFLFTLSTVNGKTLGPPPQKVDTSSVSSTAKESVGVCSLLTSAEIMAAQGEPIKETRSSLQPIGGMRMSRCSFLTPTPAKSVSLEVVAPNPADSSTLTPRKFWRNQFRSPGQREEELPSLAQSAEKSRGEDEKEMSEARRIDGLGEEAYWVGNPITGALYVLHGDIFLRISGGGVRQESARIETSKALARAAISRLRSALSSSHSD